MATAAWGDPQEALKANHPPLTPPRAAHSSSTRLESKAAEAQGRGPEHSEELQAEQGDAKSHQDLVHCYESLKTARVHCSFPT